MATRLFATTDRNASHAKLEEVLATGQHPKAECREDSNSEEPYEVWDAADVKPDAPPTPADQLAALPKDMVTAIAEKVVELLEKKEAAMKIESEGAV